MGGGYGGLKVHYVCLVNKRRVHSPLSSTVLQTQIDIQSGVQNISDSSRSTHKIIDNFIFESCL